MSTKLLETSLLCAVFSGDAGTLFCCFRIGAHRCSAAIGIVCVHCGAPSFVA